MIEGYGPERLNAPELAGAPVKAPCWTSLPGFVRVRLENLPVNTFSNIIDDFASVVSLLEHHCSKK